LKLFGSEEFDVQVRVNNLFDATSEGVERIREEIKGR